MASLVSVRLRFYANEYGCPGLLVYPKAERDVCVTFQTGGAQCSIATVDLAQPGLAGLDVLEMVVKELADMQLRPPAGLPLAR